MQCPSCRATIADNLLQCSSCGANVAVTVTAPDGQQFGPYSVQSVRQYLAEGRIAANAHASVGGGPPAPVQQVAATATAAPAAPPPLAPPAAPGAYPGGAAAVPMAAARPRKKGMSCWAIGGIIAGVLLVLMLIPALILAPVFLKGRAKAQQTSCLSNIKQISLGLLMYSSDYNEILPPADDWQAKIYPYIKNERIFTCPASGLGDQSYEYNPVLDGRNMWETIPRPAESAMLWDSGFPNGTGPHNEGWNLGFCDGHAKWMRSADHIQVSF